MRLIDADALRDLMYHESFEKDSDMQKWDSGCWIRYKLFENAIDSMPTIEAEPVKHGRWIHEHLASTGGGSYSVVRCSRCLWPEPEHPLMETNYCPNCGAKMRGEDA